MIILQTLLNNNVFKCKYNLWDFFLWRGFGKVRPHEFFLSILKRFKKIITLSFFLKIFNDKFWILDLNITSKPQTQPLLLSHALVVVMVIFGWTGGLLIFGMLYDPSLSKYILQSKQGALSVDGVSLSDD